VDFNADITLKTKDNLTALKLAIRLTKKSKNLEKQSIIELLKDYNHMNNKTIVLQENYKNCACYENIQGNIIKSYGRNFNENKFKDKAEN